MVALADTDDDQDNGDDNMSTNSDGFNVTEDFHLDEDTDADVTPPVTTSASETTDEEASPFLSSLIKNRDLNYRTFLL